MRRGMFGAWVLAIVSIVVLQSIAHLVMVLGADRAGSLLDLDRSNGIPDVVSTVVLAIAAAGAAMTSRHEMGARRLVFAVTAGLLATLTLADLLHDGAHPSRDNGPWVIALVVGTVGLLGFIAVEMGSRARVTLAVGVTLLAGSFLVGGLDRFDQWFERERGDAVTEVRIVAKEGFELLGWSFVALALWDEALTRRRPRAVNVTTGVARDSNHARASSVATSRAMAKQASD